MEKEKLFCKGGGCTAKLGAGILSRILSKLPQGPEDENLLVGYDSKDDAAVYKISDDIAFVQTLDFFPPMVDDPYTFGKIAATNALSDIYAMGGEVKTALNIVCFPEKMDLNILGEIMRGGAEKVIEAGGTLAGGHSIADSDVKYGLSVTGIVNPNKIYTNNGAKPGDALILTKRLGVGIICTANRVGEASVEAMKAVTDSMTTLNKYAAECCRNFEIHACTDVTGFSFLGHLHEMMDGQLSCHIHAKQVPVFEEALRHADEFLLTAAGQRNRNFTGPFVQFKGIPFAMEEILFDPQTSGGLLISLAKEDAPGLLDKLKASGLPAEIVGEVLAKTEPEISSAHLCNPAGGYIRWGGIDSPTDTDLLLATYKGGSHLTSDIQNGGTIMIKVNAMGDACPIPIVKTKNAIRELQGGGTVETRVDNEIAVQNLTKMANQKGYGVHSEKISDNEFKVTMTVNAEAAQAAADSAIATVEEENCPVIPAGKKNIVVVISSNQMGSGEEELGKSLLKGFIYALSQQDTLPSTILFYNSGAYITSEESASIEDLKSLEAQGVEILTCGTCLNFYGLTDKLQVGEVTNMYVIAEKMTQADLIVQP